ncbi:hypothetical protein [Halococcus sp. IIIV-5B]|uniref:hypothetical protein n=1 Tax=Halococcus sp. IIIV-5B TaxID=2321230 RepID=UPI0018F41A41|nr:hypothetical protein [Halococcus sp. IIIV-5B]
MPKREYKRKQPNKTVQLAREHALLKFNADQTDNKKYVGEDIFEMHVLICMTQTATHTQDESGWLTDDDPVPVISGCGGNPPPAS